MKIISNYDDTVQELTRILKKLDCAKNKRQTYIYGSYNENTKTLTFETVDRGEDNYRCSKDHYLIAVDPAHHEGYLDRIKRGSDLSKALGISLAELRRRAAIFFDCGEDEISDLDIITYVEISGEYDCAEIYEKYCCDEEAIINEAIKWLEDFLMAAE